MSASAGEPIHRHCDTCRCPDTGLPGNLQELDDYIDLLRTRLGEAHRQRNFFTVAAFRLPTEILGDIFLYSRDIVDHISLWLPTVSHVCSFWRAAAISWTPLWTQPDLCHSEMAAEMIRRAGGAPITLRLVVPTPRRILQPEVFHAIFSASRIKIIDFRRTGECVPKVGPPYNVHSEQLADIIVRAAHHVQHMKLFSRMHPQYYILSSAIANAVYPLLQSLTLSGWVLKEWTMPLIRHSKLLRSLTVNSSLSIEKSLQANIDRLIETLQGLQHLEHLSMIDTLRNSDSSTLTRNHRSRIYLPRLSHLQITDYHAIAIITFIEGLELPYECRISTACRVPSPADDAALLQWLLTPAPLTIGLLIQPYTVKVHTYMTDGRLQMPHHNATIPYEDINRDVHFETLGNVFSQLPESTELSISSTISPVGNLFRTPSAETVRWEWEGRPCGPVAVFLRDILVNDHAFPHLTTMIFDGLDFSRKSVGDRPEHELEDIVVALEGIPTFRTLRLLGCANIPEELLVSWSIHLPEVVLE